MRKAIIVCVFLLFFCSLSEGFLWPLVRGPAKPWDRHQPQRITATFGEFRPPSGLYYFSVDHFHEAVDMRPCSCGVQFAKVYGVV